VIYYTMCLYIPRYSNDYIAVIFTTLHADDSIYGTGVCGQIIHAYCGVVVSVLHCKVISRIYPGKCMTFVNQTGLLYFQRPGHIAGVTPSMSSVSMAIQVATN
jgi:hypothetical protein